MKRIYPIILATILAALAPSCEKAFMPPSPSANATHVFNCLWQDVDERYSMFDVKGVDWQQVYDSLRPQVRDGMDADSLFQICAAMLNTLCDGHVNLYGSWDVSRSDSVHRRFYTEEGIDIRVVVLNYMGINYHTTGGIAHNALHNGKVMYLRYGSFSNAISERQLRHIIASYPQAQGMILDLRGNGGGSISNIINLLSVMPSHGQEIYRSQIKAGPAHDDFSPLEPSFAPVNNGEVFDKPVYVLTDRGCFSATSTFAIATQAFDNLHLMGDTTGGGLGLPGMGALPNGWRYRLSVTRTLALDGSNYENGVPPDILLKFDRQGALLGRDNIIDSACSLIINNQ